MRYYVETLHHAPGWTERRLIRRLDGAEYACDLLLAVFAYLDVQSFMDWNPVQALVAGAVAGLALACQAFSEETLTSRAASPAQLEGGSK